MATPKNRENTFRVDFTNLPKKPTSEEVHTFVSRHLGVTRAQLVKLQISHTDDCAFVKVTDHSTAQRIVDTHDNTHEYDVKGVKYKLRIRMADGGVEVRLHDLSENITDEQISRHMTSYGEVLSVEDLFWSDKHVFSGCASGIKQIKMILREPIKSYITIQGETTFVTYPKQRQTCKHCGEYMHTGISCVQNKKLLAQKLGVNDRLKKGSYAGAVRTGTMGFNPMTSNCSSEVPVQSQNAPETAGALEASNFPHLVEMNIEPSSSNAVNGLNAEQLNNSPVNNKESLPNDEYETLSEATKTDDNVEQVQLTSKEGKITRSLPCGDISPISIDSDNPITPDAREETSCKHKREDFSASDESNGYREVKRSRGRTRQSANNRIGK